MLSNQYQRELAQLVKQAGSLREAIGREEGIAGNARAEANRKRADAGRALSKASRDTANRAAESADKKVAAAEKKIGDLQKKLGTNLEKQRSKDQSLRSAVRNEQAAADSVDEQRRRREKAEADARARADAKRRELEKSHAREVGRLSSPVVRHVMVRLPEPERLRVLYLTASPATDGAAPLRVDAEVNGVLKALRGAKHRDLVDVLHRPAATVQDLVDGLNDHRPHVVHFSGHAGGGLLFDNASATQPGEQMVGYATVARLLAATDRRPDLVVLNACNTMDGAAEMLAAANVVIATTESVGDASAAIFASHFYAAIGAAQTIGHAVNQARAMIAVALPDEPDLIRIVAVEEVDPYDLRLVRPGDQAP